MTSAGRLAIGVLLAASLAACSSEPAPAAPSAPAATVAPDEVMPAAEGPRLFVSNEESGTVSVIDVNSRKVVFTIPVGKRPRGIRVSPDRQTVFVALSGSAMGGPNVDESTLPPPQREFDGIGVIEADTGKLMRVLHGGPDPEQFAVSADGKNLFIANEDAGKVSVLDVATGNILKEIEVGDEPEGVDLSPDGKVVYVTSEAHNEVAVIDAVTLDLVKTIAVGARPRSTGFLPSAARAYVSAENQAAVELVDTVNHKVVQRIAIPGEGAKPMGVQASPDGTSVYVTTGRGKSVARIDSATNEVTGTVEVGERPWGLAISTDGSMLFTANGPSNDVTIVDLKRWAVVEKIAVGNRPWGVALLH